MGALVLIGIIAAIVFLVNVFSWRRSASELKSHLREQGTIASQRAELARQVFDRDSEYKVQQAHIEKLRLDIESRKVALNQLATEKSAGFPYLADAWVEYMEIRDKTFEAALRYKSHPALKAAEAIKEFGAERRRSTRQMKITEYKLKLYEALFPWITEFTEEGIEDAYLRVGGDVDLQDDPRRKWVSEGEWKQLSPSKRSQVALDRYCSRKKSPWEIGRDYERYVGHLYEEQGYYVHYMGAVEGFDDLGRDLVVKDGRGTKIIQCKYWADHKQIHEKHIFQLFGTCVEYGLRKRFGERYERTDLFGKDGILDGIEPVLYTSTKLSDRANSFASALGVSIFEAFRLSPYPMIKCNIAQNGGEKIYHLPFDQQYDKVLITKRTGECYATTIEEAEALGFRRAFRWISKT